MTATAQLTWPECRNVRDLGGLPTIAGGAIRPGALIRSDNLDRLTPVGIAAVRAAGVSRIVDVRTAWECEHFPSPFRDDPIWRNTPLSDPDDAGDPDLDMVVQYTSQLDRYPRRIAAAVGEIAKSPPGAVVVACHAGKDRTGVIVALVLSLAGVAPDVIAADYATVGDSTMDIRTVIGVTAADPLLPELEPPVAATMLAMLDHLSTRYGGTAEYLAAGGLTPSQATALITRITKHDRDER